MADIIGFPHGHHQNNYPCDVEPPCEGDGKSEKWNGKTEEWPLEEVINQLPAPTEIELSEGSKMLAQASSLIDGERHGQHGPRQEQFASCAEAWAWWLGVQVTPHDVAMMNALQKMSRIKCGHHNRDNYVDIGGYDAIAYELAKEAFKR